MVIFPSFYLLVTIASMLVDVINQKFNKQAKLGVEPLHWWSKSIVDSEYTPVLLPIGHLRIQLYEIQNIQLGQLMLLHNIHTAVLCNTYWIIEAFYSLGGGAVPGKAACGGFVPPGMLKRRKKLWVFFICNYFVMVKRELKKEDKPWVFFICNYYHG